MGDGPNVSSPLDSSSESRKVFAADDVVTIAQKPSRDPAISVVGAEKQPSTTDELTVAVEPASPELCPGAARE